MPAVVADPFAVNVDCPSTVSAMTASGRKATVVRVGATVAVVVAPAVAAEVAVADAATAVLVVVAEAVAGR